MKVARTIEEVRQARSNMKRVGFVPTMGAFHDGHLELMRRARSECDSVVVSLFVNPTQFAPHEDLDKYPRRETADFEMAESAGVDLIFAPSAEEIYTRRTTTIHVDEVGKPFEGELRPGHFDGVATVVLKLFNIVKPDVAFFGLKDLQQCAVVQRMVEDLNVEVQLRFVETVREADGMAMSSRNMYLSANDRRGANQLYRILREVAERIRSGEKNEIALREGRERLAVAGFTVDYIAMVDPGSMKTSDQVSPTTRIVAAARFGGVRLLDNVAVIE